MTVLGIDPGGSGGIALLSDDGNFARVWRMPATEKDVWDAIRACAITNFGEEVHAVIEKAQAMPKQGVSSTFKFGVSYGGLRMALVAAGIPFESVAAGVWQRNLGCLTKGDKNITKRKAQELFPQVTVTHKVSDALLIAEWGRRRHMVFKEVKV